MDHTWELCVYLGVDYSGYFTVWSCWTLQWCHNKCNDISNRQPHDCWINRLFRHWSKKTSKLHITGLCEGNSPVTSEFPEQRASYTKNVSIWWHHYETTSISCRILSKGPLSSQLWASWMSSLPVSVPIFRWRMIPLEIFFRILTIDTLWLALTGQFWGVFCELKIYLWYNAALYCWQKSYVHSLWVALYMNIYIYVHTPFCMKTSQAWCCIIWLF